MALEEPTETDLWTNRIKSRLLAPADNTRIVALKKTNSNRVMASQGQTATEL